MKKFIALAVAVVMLAVLAIPAFAALGNFTDGTEVTYTKLQTYVITVPEGIYVDGGEGAIEVSDYSVSSARQLKITPDANNGAMTNAEDESVVENAFAVELNGSTETAFVYFNGANQTATIKAVSTSDTPTEPGTYIGAITYTVELVLK